MARSSLNWVCKQMKVAITGASGLIGSALARSLRAQGNEVISLVRRSTSAPDEVSWDPVAGTIDATKLAGVDAVVHLAGAGVGDKRWSEAYKKEILSSRVLGTSLIANTIADLNPKPSVFISGSAIGFYGDTADVAVNESSPAGSGFLADVVREWEAAATPAISAGIRTVFLRTGLVVSKSGGAWARLFPIFKLGGGGKLGSGNQYWSFISLRDEVRAIEFAIANSNVEGVVNLTAPNPVTNAEVTAAMGRVLGRPTVLPVPGFALKAALGEFSVEVLGSARVLPNALERAGFTWLDPTIDDAIRAGLEA